MFKNTNLIKPYMNQEAGLNHFIGNNCPEFRDGLLDSYFFQLTLRSGCLEFCSWAVAFKTILTQ